MGNSLFRYNVQSFLVQRGDPYASAYTGILPLSRVQSVNTSLVFPRQDEFDWQGDGAEVMVERPTAQMEVAYYPTNGLNERNIGFYTDGGRPALLGLNSEQNYYSIVNLTNQDMQGYGGDATRILALGNGVVTNFTANANTDQFLDSSVTLEGLNLLIQTGRFNEQLPSIVKRDASAVTGRYSISTFSGTAYSSTNLANNISATRPGDIVLQFDSGSSVGIAMSGANACPLQSFSIGISLPRVSVKDLGWAYPANRPLQWPISVNVQAQGYVTDYQLAALNQFNCPDSGYGIDLLVKQPCSDELAIAYSLRGAKLESQAISSQIVGSNRVTFSWTAKIYDLSRSGVNDPNFYIQGFGGNVFFVYDYSAVMSGTDAFGAAYTYTQDYYRKVLV